MKQDAFGRRGIFEPGEKPTQGTVLSVQSTSVTVRGGSVVYTNVFVAPPLSIEDIQPGHIVALIWSGNSCSAFAVIGYEGLAGPSWGVRRYPSPPTGLAWVLQSGVGTLTWNAPNSPSLAYYTVDASQTNWGNSYSGYPASNGLVTWHTPGIKNPSGVIPALYFRVAVTNQSGLRSAWSSVVGPYADTSVPPQIAGLVATSKIGAVKLMWGMTYPTDFDRYEVYRATSSTGTGKQVVANIGKTNTHTQTAPQGTWYWWVLPYDTSGNHPNLPTSGWVKGSPSAPGGGINQNLGKLGEDGYPIGWELCEQKDTVVPQWSDAKVLDSSWSMLLECKTGTSSSTGSFVAASTVNPISIEPGLASGYNIVLNTWLTTASGTNNLSVRLWEYDSEFTLLQEQDVSQGRFTEYTSLSTEWTRNVLPITLNPGTEYVHLGLVFSGETYSAQNIHIGQVSLSRDMGERRAAQRDFESITIHVVPDTVGLLVRGRTGDTSSVDMVQVQDRFWQRTFFAIDKDGVVQVRFNPLTLYEDWDGATPGMRLNSHVPSIDIAPVSMGDSPEFHWLRLFVDDSTEHLFVRNSHGDDTDLMAVAGAVPTGTGFRHITSGSEDAAAKLVENVDVHASAGIVESKLALNYATHAMLHGLSGADHTGSLGSGQHGTLSDGDHTGNLSGNARVSVRKSSAGSAYTRRRLNFIPSGALNITLADDSTDEEVDITIASPSLANTVVSEIAFGQAATAGTDNAVSRRDHTHGTPALAHLLVSSAHTATGLTAGHVLKASSTTEFAFAQLLHSQIGGVSANDHHNQVHTVTGTDHTFPGGSTFLRADGTWQTVSGGSTPSGTGFRHVTVGVEDALAKLVFDDDIDAEAKIDEGKLALGYPTHAQAHAINGADHTATGLTAGHVLKASGPTAFSFAQLLHSQLGSIASGDHHEPVTISHELEELLTMSVQALDLVEQNNNYIFAGPTSGETVAAPTFRAMVLNDLVVHALISDRHTVSGSANQVIGLTGANTLGLLTPSSTPGASTLVRTGSSSEVQLTRLGVGQAPTADNNIMYSGDLTPYRNATAYTGYVIVPIDPVTGTYTNQASTAIDLQAAPFSLPAGIKGVIVNFGYKAGVAGKTGALRKASGDNNAIYTYSMNATYATRLGGMVQCDANGDIYFYTDYSTSNSVEVTVNGYLI
jgi:hypothetical protein